MSAADQIRALAGSGAVLAARDALLAALGVTE